ncbi:hypothetical protein K438DRAFT_1789020 [Mycena galopus ATCC 62051]|nr:hypothetical protein K438DRAFT_1789020 [Mycena galopus ATCC 62051]
MSDATEVKKILESFRYLQDGFLNTGFNATAVARWPRDYLMEFSCLHDKAAGAPSSRPWLWSFASATTPVCGFYPNPLPLKRTCEDAWPTERRECRGNGKIATLMITSLKNTWKIVTPQHNIERIGAATPAQYLPFMEEKQYPSVRFKLCHTRRGKALLRRSLGPQASTPLARHLKMGDARETDATEHPGLEPPCRFAKLALIFPLLLRDMQYSPRVQTQWSLHVTIQAF